MFKLSACKFHNFKNIIKQLCATEQFIYKLEHTCIVYITYIITMPKMCTNCKKLLIFEQG